MSDKIYFMYERLTPLKYPEPRNLRSQLESHMAHKYKDQPISKITLSTEFVLKSIIPKDGSPEKPLLKYKVLNVDWEDMRELKDLKFDKKMIRWVKNEEPDYEGGGGD
jgi:hypothetical protein